MNADWAKGRNERTGNEGIFPRSYVQILDEKKNAMVPQQQQMMPSSSSGYGNMPLEVSQSGSGAVAGSGGGGESKFNQQGKKFGKKMGNAGMSSTFFFSSYSLRPSHHLRMGIANANIHCFFTAIFGAGATIGSNIVNGIF